MQADQVNQIVVWAMAKGIESPCAIGWEDVVREGRDTVIINQSFIDSFVVLINNLHPRRMDFVSDKRCVAIIKSISGDSLIVALGEHGGIHINGNPMQEDHRVIDFIDKYVYGPYSWDYWFSDEERELFRIQRQFFNELDSQAK